MIWPNVARLSSLTLILIEVALSLAIAQEFRALVSGKVTDISGAAIADARISILDVATALRSSTVSGSDGNYALPQLSPGKYELMVEAAGFRTYRRQGITLAVGDKASLDVRIEIGDVTSSVTVNADLTGIEGNQDITGQTSCAATGLATNRPPCASVRRRF